LFRPSETGLYVNFNVNGELRGEIEKRAAFYDKMLTLGAMSPNDIRELEDLNPVPDGDKYFVTNNVQPLEFAVREPEPEPTPQPDEPDDEPEARLRTLKMLAKTHQPLLADALARLLRAEATKAKKSKGKSVCDMQDADYSAHVVGAIAPACEAFVCAGMAVLDADSRAESTQKSILDCIKAISARHIKRSMQERDGEQAVALWANGERAGGQAAKEMESLTELVLKLTGAAK
jgi:hypothetical protein